MTFDPKTFLASVDLLYSCSATDPCVQAHYRSALGRCYYAVYGELAEKVCQAKGKTRRQLFDSRGRHKELDTALSRASLDLKKVEPYFKSLLARRVKADYDYVSAVAEADVEDAKEEAEDALDALALVAARDFVTFPF